MTDYNWKFLVVDDDPDKLNELKRVLSRMTQYKINVETESSFEAAKSRIENERFDLLFLDVSDESDKLDDAGINVFNQLQSVRFVPVIFYTGFAYKVEHLKSPIVKVVTKGSDIDEIKKAVVGIMDTKLPYLIRHIEEKSREYMWDSFSKIESSFLSKIDGVDISILLARQISKNLSQNVVKELIAVDSEKINPLEMYLYPPDVSRCNPGDIFVRIDERSMWMVLTAACDLAQDKAENVLLARILPISEHEYFVTYASEKDSKSKGKIRELVSNKLLRYKFLPKSFFIEDSLVDYQNLSSVPTFEASKYEKLCSLDNPYREEFIQAFSNFYGRIGTPDYNKEEIFKRIVGIVN